MVTAMKTSLENITLFQFVLLHNNISTHSTCTKTANLPRNPAGVRGIQVKKENEKFTIVCSCSAQNFEFGHFIILKGTCRAIVFLTSYSPTVPISQWVDY